MRKRVWRSARTSTRHSAGTAGRNPWRTIAAGGLALLLTACGARPAHTGPLTVVHVAALPVVDDAPLYIARQKGLFRAEGLDVKIKTIAQSTLAVPGLLNGTIDIVGGANYVSFFQAAARKVLDVQIVADAYQTTSGVAAVLTMPDERDKIRDPRDLQGKKVAFSLLKSVTTMTFDESMRAHDVDPTKVDHVEVAFPQMAAALKSHSVDAAYMVEPFITAAQEKLGAREVLDPVTGPTNQWPMSGYISTRKWTDAHPQAAAAFQRAMFRAQAQTRRADVEKILPTYSKINRRTAAVITLGTYPSSISATRLRRVEDLMYRSGMLPHHLDVDALIYRAH